MFFTLNILSAFKIIEILMNLLIDAMHILLKSFVSNTYHLSFYYLDIEVQLHSSLLIGTLSFKYKGHLM